MKTIFKYKLGFGRVTASIPAGAEVLHFATQDRWMCIWALVDTDNAAITRHFEVVGTGHALDESAAYKYIGTLQDPPYVWHLFEVTP